MFKSIIFSMGLNSSEWLPFKCSLCIGEAVERQRSLSEQFSIQNTVFVKGLELACLNEDLKYYNKDHPLWFHKRTAHFQMNLMLMECIKLTVKEVKLLFIVTMYGKAEAEQESPLKQRCVLCVIWRKISEHFIFTSLQNQPMRLLRVQIGS